MCQWMFYVPSLSSNFLSLQFNRDKTHLTLPQKYGVNQDFKAPLAHPKLKLCINTNEFFSYRLIIFHPVFYDLRTSLAHSWQMEVLCLLDKLKFKCDLQIQTVSGCHSWVRNWYAVYSGYGILCSVGFLCLGSVQDV